MMEDVRHILNTTVLIVVERSQENKVDKPEVACSPKENQHQILEIHENLKKT
jgi:hypothetical protein